MNQTKANNVGEKIGLVFALIMASFVLFVIQIIIETIMNFFVDADIATIIGLVFISLFAFVMLFVFNIFVKYVENEYVKNKTRLVNIVFYYVLPIAFYLVFHFVLKMEKSAVLPIFVVLVSLCVRYALDWLYYVMNKKTKKQKINAS